MFVRYAFIVEYDGTRYAGWQLQKNLPTIQGHVERAISQVANQNIKVYCAGRTDAGVHAIGQVIHCNLPAHYPLEAWVKGSNCYLPNDIKISKVLAVSNNFDARRSALYRRYCYVLYNYSRRPAILRHMVAWEHRKLDYLKMAQAARYWIGEHDFSSFRGSDCQSISTIKQIKQIEVKKCGDFVFFDVIGNAFLHHMVRNMVGTLITIGSSNMFEAQYAKTVLHGRHRSFARNMAPAQGLYLVRVYYPDFDYGLEEENNNPLKQLGWFIS